MKTFQQRKETHYKTTTSKPFCQTGYNVSMRGPTLFMSAREFSYHFKPSFSQIGKPDSHGRYASQRETPLAPLYFYPLCRITPRRTKNDIVIGEDYGTITLGIPMGYTAE